MGVTGALWVVMAAVLAADGGAADVPAPVDRGVGCARAKIEAARDASRPPHAKHRDDSNHGLTDVRHYRLDFEIDPTSRTLDGSTTMTVASRTNGLTSFRFWLDDAMAISSVTVDARTAAWERRNPVAVDVELGRGYDEGEVFVLEIAYRGTPPPSWFFSTQDGVPVVSTLSQPWNASDWWAVKDDNSDKATGELLVTVPAELTVVSNGTLVRIDALSGERRRFHWATDYPTSPYLFAFSATEYETFNETYLSDGRPVPVEFFIYPQSDSDDHRAGWRRTLDMLAVFEALFGPYPFADEKYAIYQFPFGGGMEHQTATGQGGIHAFGEPLTSHELAHQWWGDLVTCATWHDIWLNEGFATYSTALWYEFESGTSNPEARREYMNIRRPQWLSGSVWVEDVSNPSRIFSSNYSYSKGAWVLHMLRGVLGDSTFFDTLAAYRERHAFATATTEDLRAVAEEVWGGDLEWFFDQWVYGGGAPSYRFAWQEHEIDGRRYLELMLEQTQSGGVFEMPVDIAVHTSGGDEDRSVWNRAPLEHHLLPVGGAVDSVELDPQEWILSRLVEESFFTPGPPKIVSVSPPPAAVLAAGRTVALEIVFHRDVAVDGTEFTLRRADGRAVEIVVGYDPASHTATVASRAPLAGGRYRLVIDDTLLGAADGLALDGEVHGVLPSGDGVPGGEAHFEFAVLGVRSPDRRVPTAR